MLAKLFYLNFWFSRSRLRRGPVIDPKLKDLTTTHAIKKKIKEYRAQFQTSDLNETFTQVFKQKKPVLGKRFKIDTVKLNKTLKKSINERITPESLTPVGAKQDDLKFLNESKSYLHNQRLQIEFQQKFKKELFMKKQTNRMLKKEENSYKNYLPENAGNKFNKYLEAKTKLKNNRIESMMNYKKNNDELQLLIESGFMDQPDNLKMIIEKMNKNRQPLLSESSVQNNTSSTSVSIVEESDNQVKLHQDPLKGQMLSKVTGPEQTRDYSKIQQFLQIYKGSDAEMKKKCEQSVDLLLKVKQYQRNLFLSRYDMINYRFRGQVDFTYFKEPQLLSYIKTQTITPVELLLIFEQNKENLNKFNLPIITPAVTARIYSKTSTYRFSQTDQNNKVNMLNDPIFRKLQSTLFRQLDKINDQHFCDAVWAYACNHQLQQGLLNVKKSDAIQRAIFSQLKQRIGHLSQQDLGLLLRSIVKLNLFTNEAYNQQWTQITQVLQSRLPLIKQSYEYESTLQFLSLIPTNNKSLAIIAQNISYFKKYEWEQKSTLLVFSRVCAAIIKWQHLIDPFTQNKTLTILKQILSQKAQQANSILPTLTINEISRALVVFEQLNKIPFGPALPKMLVNIAKKEIVSSIHTQKHKIYQYTLPTLITTLSKYDYYENIIKKQQRYIDKDILLKPYNNVSLLKVVTLRQLLPQRVFTLNSKLYFVYHEIARLLEKQESNISTRALAESIFGLCLVQYKNEGIIDSLAYKILEKVEKQHKNDEPLTLHQTINLIKIVNAYSLQKRVTDTVDQICSKIITSGKQHFKQVQLNLLISFFGSYTNLYTMPTQLPKQNTEQDSSLRQLADLQTREQMQRLQSVALQRWSMNKNFTIAYLYGYKNYISPFLPKLQVEQLITLYLVHTMILNNINRIIITNPQLENEYSIINQKCKNQMKQLLNFIRQQDRELKNDYRFVLSLCIELNSLDIPLQQTSQKQRQFQTIQKQFYDKYINNILKHQEHIGVNLNYNQIYQEVYQKLNKQNQAQIQKKIWRIEDKSTSTVYFCATFDHLMAKYYHEQTTLGLFGLWRIYLQIYKRKNWKTQLVCTMLQK